MIGCQNKNQFNFIVKNPGNQPLIELQNMEAENRLHPLSMSSKMKSKYFPKFLFAILLAFLLSAIPTFSVGFTKGTSRDAWWYDLGNGNYLRSTWQWIDSDNDGVAECYYFDHNGWLYANSVTPDGYTVDHNGAWTENSVVQRKHSQGGNKSQTASSGNVAYQKETLARINQFRAGYGLRNLAESESLNAMAAERARECSVSFSHTRPQGGSILDVSEVCGEILSYNNETPSRTVNAWIASPGHNQIMSNSEFLRFGAGYYLDEKGNNYWVVLFGY